MIILFIFIKMDYYQNKILERKLDKVIKKKFKKSLYLNYRKIFICIIWRNLE